MEIRLNIVLDISDRMERVLLDIAGRPPDPRTQETPRDGKGSPSERSKPKTVDESAEMPFDRETAPEKPQSARRGGGAAARQMLGRESARTHMDARFRAPDRR